MRRPFLDPAEPARRFDNPVVASNGRCSVEDIIRIVLGLDRLEPGVILPIEGLCPIRIMPVTLFHDQRLAYKFK